MAKFKVGDIVIGNEHARCYSITRRDWVGKVLSVRYPDYESRDIQVITINRQARGNEADAYWVSARCFDLRNPPVIDPTKPVKTRSGASVFLDKSDDPERPISATFWFDGGERTFSYPLTGHFYKGETLDIDLVNVVTES